MFQFYYLLFFVLFIRYGSLAEITKMDLENMCLDGKYHKKSPSEELTLSKECSIWKHRSCCNTTTAKAISEMKLHQFNHDHCKHIKPLSDECKSFFVQELCFYECSPNYGPWIIDEKIKKKFRKQRLSGAPLCSFDCDKWYNACKDDYTCAEVWLYHFKWENGTNKCKEGSECITFTQMYTNSKQFCEKIWDNAFKVVNDNCLHLTFNPEFGNPNDNVTKKFAELLSSNSSRNYSILSYILVLFSVIVQFVFEIKILRF